MPTDQRRFFTKMRKTARHSQATPSTAIAQFVVQAIDPTLTGTELTGSENLA
jgi:hypothetical protein